MKYAITDLTYEEMLRCTDLLSAASPHGATVGAPVGYTPPAIELPQPHTQAGPTLMGPVPTDPIVAAAEQTVVQPVAQPVAAGTVPAVDANGIPWDGRIHASTKRQNKDGTWTYKKGVDKNLIPVVEAEIGGGQPINTTHVVAENIEQPVPIAAAVPVDNAVPAAMQLTAEQITAGPAAVPVDNAPAVAQPVAAVADFGTLMQVMSQAIQTAKFDAADVATMNTLFGITNIQALNGDAARIAQAILHIQTTVANKAPAQ